MFARIASFLLCSSGLALAAPVDFERDIRPILAEKCTLCHGPDDAKGGLRLTGLKQARVTLDSGKIAIVPGNHEASEMMVRTRHSDPDSVMPPPGKAEPLTEVEKDLLAQWIDEGADWPQHWAYTPLERPSPPEVSKLKNPLDAFVVAQLERENVAPSPEADPVTLIRRLFYDLIGLPPSVEQVDRYIAAVRSDPEAGWAQLVDDLLASEHFGERWGRHWLDIARYADSDGYEKDNGRPDAWRYRDWVIYAINEDMPFDQFTIEQFAGDLLEEATPDQQLATAFNRQTLTNTEGGTDQEQWRVAAVMDRVETMGAAWMGLTLSCARCHTHKFDAITHHEYYQLFAYFNNGDEGTTKVPTSKDAWQDYEEAKVAHDAAVGPLKERYQAARAKLSESDVSDLLRGSTESHEEAYAALVIKTIAGPKGVTFTQQEDGTQLVGGKNPAIATYTIEGSIPAGDLTGIRLEVLGNGPGRTEHGNFVLNHIQLTVDGEERLLAGSEASFSQEGWPIEKALDPNSQSEKKGTGWAIAPRSKEAHTALFGLAQPLLLDEPETSFKLTLTQHYGSQHTLGQFRISALTSPTPLKWPNDLRQLTADREVTAEERQRVGDFLAKLHPKTRTLVNELAELEAKAPKKPEMNVRVLKERRDKRRLTHVLHRGEFKQPTDQVEPGALASLPAITHRKESPGDRLDLARWLVSGENPLPPRVFANHVWAHLFGEGLVSTLNDFGVRGERPTHPQVLDWLASELVSNGWSRKELIRTIVSSSTYRQSSHVRPELLETDPKNLWLARQNRFRVEAEIVRDTALSASGLLSSSIGGPSVFPPIPKGVSDLNYNSAFKWQVSPGEDRYRRGLYTYFKRTAPHPNLTTFDCPDSNVTCIQRTRSNTPLAALITLNNATFAEAARALAKRVADGPDRIEHAFLHCLSRSPQASEAKQLQALLETSEAYYQKHPEAAEQLSPSAPELAPLTATVRVILNLDEFLTRN